MACDSINDMRSRLYMLDVVVEVWTTGVPSSVRPDCARRRESLASSAKTNTTSECNYSHRLQHQARDSLHSTEDEENTLYE
jgi:hypothetical protein